MKEKIINYIETLEAKSLQVDDYFKQRNDLYISNQEKDEEIERLNNIINELENYFNKIKDTSTLEERMIAKYMLKYIKELKGEDKE